MDPLHHDVTCPKCETPDPKIAWRPAHDAYEELRPDAGWVGKGGYPSQEQLAQMDRRYKTRHPAKPERFEVTCSRCGYRLPDMAPLDRQVAGQPR